MLFNSFEFVVFFPLVVALYFATPARHRWMLLLAASYYFYACWKLEYLTLIIASTVVDYWAGRQMGKHEDRARRRPYLILSLLTNLGILFAFKYFNFFNESVRAVFDQFNLFYGVPAFDVLLPVGISFYTFQTLAYSIDVYRDQKEPEEHLGYFALYVSFFPQLVAGPIERSQNLLPQFKKTYAFDYARVTSGLKLMAWGFFKKVVVADRLALYVDAVYNNPEAHSGWPVVVATYFFAFQIYCDFSGYSDIAIGTARVMGYDLMENFRRPYFSKSISEFWRRWHISLSTWFKDYLYIPLGGNRVATYRWYVNLFVVFLVSGLWHGAAWTFVIWGALHGIYLIAGAATMKQREQVWERIEAWIDAPAPATGAARAGFAPPTLPPALLGTARWGAALKKVWRVFVTFHLVLVAWVFFRANSLADALTLLGSAFDGSTPLLVPGVAAYGMALSLLGIAALLVVHLVERRGALADVLDTQPTAVRWGVYYAMILSIFLFGVFGQQQFIYFQF